MSETLKAMIARRPLLAGGLALLGVAAAGGAAYEAGLFGPSYPRSPYDDLLALLPDRAQARMVGKVLLTDNPAFDAKTVAEALRTRLNGKPLAGVLAADVEANAITEVAGWVMPATLAQLSALAALSD